MILDYAVNNILIVFTIIKFLQDSLIFFSAHLDHSASFQEGTKQYCVHYFGKDVFRSMVVWLDPRIKVSFNE